MSGQLELAFVVVVVCHLHQFDIQIERLAGEQALVPTISIVELYEVLSIQFGRHQLLFHRPLGFTRRVECEAVILVVEPRNLALHLEGEVFVGELVVEELVYRLGIGNLLLDV